MADVAELGFKVDSSGARKAADDLNRMSASAGRAESATGRLGRAAQGAGRSFAQFAAVLRRGALVAAGFAAAAGAAMIAMVRSTLASVDAQAKLARSLDASIDGLRGLQIAAADAGVSTGGLQSGIEMLTRRLGEAERAGTPAANALQRLGLTATDLIGLDVDERMALLADRVQGLGLSASQAGDLLRQFGIRNSEMINLLRGGGDAIRAARQEVEDFGLSISAVDAAGIERANDAMSRIGRVIEVVATRLTVALAPALEVAANWLNEITRQHGGWRQAAESAAESVVAAVIWIVDTYERANLAAARFLLVFQETEAAAARAGATMRGLFRFEATDYQRELIAAAEAQRAFIQELENAAPMGERLAVMFQEAKAAAASAVAETRNFGGAIDDVMAPAVASVEAVRNVFADLRNDMARGIQMEQINFLEAIGRSEDAAALRHEIEQIDLIARGQGELSGQQIDYLLEQLEIQRQIRAETEAALAVDQVRQELAQVFTSDLDRRTAMYTQQMEILREALDMELITRDEYRELEMQAIVAFDEWKLERQAAMEAEQLEHMRRIKEVEDQLHRERLQAANQFFGNMAAAAAAGGNKMFKVAQMFSIAQTIMSGIEAAEDAWKWGMKLGGPALAAAFAGASAAASAARVAQIASMSPNSGNRRSVSAGSTGAAAPVAPPVPRAQDVTIRLDSNRTLFSRGEIEQILEGLNDALADGAQIRIAR